MLGFWTNAVQGFLGGGPIRFKVCVFFLFFFGFGPMRFKVVFFFGPMRFKFFLLD